MSGLPVGEIFDRRYEIVRLLGSGGMGTVYEARDTLLGRRVALKIPHSHLLEPSHRTRFHREAIAAARLWHPNICPIFDIGDANGTLYITMAYLDGRPLGALVHDGESIDATLATRLLRTLAGALQAAHDAGVLHLDLKPANIMVGPYSNPIIMDFGLSRLIVEAQDTAVHDAATLDFGLLGTPAYMAPEQIAGQAEAVSTATDIYALGIVFYELLTGRPPFQGSLLSVLEQASRETPPSLRIRCPTLDERLERVCMQMLAKNPSERPRSMNEVVEALEKIEGSERPDRVPPRRAPSDRERLSDMLDRRQAWEALYYAKRLLQVNQHDAEAYNALSRLSEDPRDLVYFDESRKRHLPNAFTRSMDMKTLVDFVRESGLIERDDGDVICRYNDPSDNMFLILRGDVGVYIPHAEPVEPDAQGPDFRLGAGHIVGELAFALKRSRTATVRALGRASLLAFSFARLKELADRGLMGHALSTSVDSYLKRRVLKFLFDSARYLSSTSAHVVDRGELVNHHADVIAIDHQQHPILEPDACSRFPEKRGLVILASGEARARYLDGKLLCDRDLPILYAHFDDRLVYTHARYEIDRPVTLIHLHQAAFHELDPVARGALQEVISAARTTCVTQCHFDVFLSYMKRDLDIAMRWKSRLEAATLRVFMDVQKPPARFAPAIQAAILDSLVFMPLLTENTAARRKRENWFQHEIRYRSDVFGDRANIVPVNLGGGKVAEAAPGHSSIDAMGRESDAIEQIVTLVRQLRSGELPPDRREPPNHNTRGPDNARTSSPGSEPSPRRPQMKHTILFLAATPIETAQLALDRDARAIQKELERSGLRDRFELVTRWAVEPLDLLRELRRLKPTVVHFSGHGSQMAAGPHRPGERQHGLFFQGADGRPQFVSAQAIEETFGAAGRSVQLVVLNACYSDIQADALLAHVDCIVGMSGAIGDDAARSFAIGFYGALGDHESVAAAYKHGRAAISLEGQHDSDHPQLKVRAGIDACRLVLAADPPASRSS